MHPVKVSECVAPARIHVGPSVTNLRLLFRESKKLAKKLGKEKGHGKEEGVVDV